MTLHEKLLDEGWRTFTDPFRKKRTCYAKSFEGHAKCACNTPKNKQVELYHYPSDRIAGLDLPESWHVELNGELPDGEWVRMTVEGLKTFDQITSKAKDLLTAWDHLVSITPTVIKE